jgi:hypothetical protein
LTNIITELQNLDLDIKDQGHPADYVGVNIKRLRDGSIELSKWALIDTIIEDVDLEDSKVKSVPAKSNKHLHAHLDKPEFTLNFNYRSLIWQAQLFGSNYTTRHHVCHAPTRKVLFKPSGTTWRSSLLSRSLSEKDS